MRRIAAIFLLPLLVLSQQPPPAPATPLLPGVVNFEVTSNLVVVNVSVRGRDGRPVEGLKKSDFVVTEDGKPQKISVFEFQRLSTQPLPPLATPALTTREAPKAVKPAAPPPAAAPAAGQLRYKDRRLIVLFFDLSSMQPAEQIRAEKASLKFLNERMTSSDLVAIMTFSTQVNLVQDFTGDRQLLIDTIRRFQTGDMSELATPGSTPDSNSDDTTDTGYTADETEFNVFNTDLKLSALQDAARRLQTFPEKKALVYFSSGVGKTGVENQSQLLATTNAAVRANVSFYPVDARGLEAMPPGGDATTTTSGGSGLYSGNTQQTQRNQFNDQQETLSTLAEDTGGKALLDSNNLGLGIEQAQKDVNSYYILGYYSSNLAEDGRYRRMKVEVASDRRAKLDYRNGYYASKEFKKFNADDKELQLEEALRLGNPLTDIPIALEVDYFRIGRDLYFVPLAVKLAGSAISTAKKGSNQVSNLDFIGEVRDARSHLVSSVRDNIHVKLGQENASRLSSRYLQYDTGFTLAPGVYDIKFLARENETGKMGTFETHFTVPDLRTDSKLRLSSVIWANQREAVASAVGSASNSKKVISKDPLIQDGQKLVPSITHVFRKDQHLYVYFEVYDPASRPADKSSSIAATLSIFRGSRKTFETAPIRIDQPANARVPVQFQVPLDKLPPGNYTCQINLIDEVARKFSFPRAPLILMP